MNVNSAIQLAIVIGQAVISDDEISEDELDRIRNLSRINRIGVKHCFDIAADLSDGDLAALIMGLTLAEARFSWSGGSAAASIWLFKSLAERCEDREFVDRVSSWVLENGRNPYSPFGSQITLGAGSYSEYLELSGKRSAKIAIRQQQDVALEVKAQDERAERQRLSKNATADRNSPERVALIADLEKLSLDKQLWTIAYHDSYPPQFFPANIAKAATGEVLAGLEYDTRLALARRLKGKRRGPWGDFKKRLLENLGPMWNKEPWQL